MGRWPTAVRRRATHSGLERRGQLGAEARVAAEAPRPGRRGGEEDGCGVSATAGPERREQHGAKVVLLRGGTRSLSVPSARFNSIHSISSGPQP